ncbi:MAG TPA: hypothetical protein VJT75_04135 [Thermoleophilaceae bacterium]|nr:hypothetical protein [Thermoleophilaceae bacterium]
MAAAALLALPASGHAAVMTIGSDLTKEANVFEAHGADAAFWNTSIDGQPGAIPADGQITFIRVKGSVVDDPRHRRYSGTKPLDPQFHFQVLHPISGGRQMRVMLSSAPFRLPVTLDGDSSAETQQISGYKPVNLCVRKGDYVDFNDIGGHEWSWPERSTIDGMHVQVFSRTPGSTVGFYSKNNGTNINSEWTPAAFNQGEELLMQMKLATAPDASDICEGGYMQHIFRGLNVKARSASLSARKRTVKVAVNCPVSTYGSCKGVLVLKAPINGTLTTLGGVPFNVRSSYGASLLVKLSDQITKKVLKLGGVKATVTADAHDDPRNDKRAHPTVPVQKKTTRGAIRISPSS